MRVAMMMAGALALAGCAASAQMQASEAAEAQKDLAKALEGRVAGEMRDCISASSANGPQIIDSKTLLYRDGSRIWRNDIEGTCPSLREGNPIVIEIHGSQLCRMDKFRVIEPGSSIPSSFCFLGKFTEYKKPKG